MPAPSPTTLYIQCYSTDVSETDGTTVTGRGTVFAARSCLERKVDIGAK